MKKNNLSYKLKFIESTRFMASLLSNLVNNLAEGIHPIKCKHGHDKKLCEKGGVKYKGWDCYLQYRNVKDDLIEYKCLYCNKLYPTALMETFYSHLHMEYVTDADKKCT